MKLELELKLKSKLKRTAKQFVGSSSSEQTWLLVWSTLCLQEPEQEQERASRQAYPTLPTSSIYQGKDFMAGTKNQVTKQPPIAPAPLHYILKYLSGEAGLVVYEILGKQGFVNPEQAYLWLEQQTGSRVE